MRHGRGIHQHLNGTKYDGDWSQDIKQGYGQITSASNEHIYRGTFKNGNYENGKGVRQVNGGSYTGSFKKGLIYGQGTMFFSDGREYRGRWKKNIITGFGTMKWPSGRTYKGLWDENEIAGHGLMIQTDGTLDTGNWKTMANGSIVMKNSDNSGTICNVDSTYYRGPLDGKV